MWLIYIAVSALLIWLFIQFTWVMLRFCYMLFLGIPFAMLATVLGLVLCITIIGIPLGKALLGFVGKILYPF